MPGNIKDPGLQQAQITALLLMSYLWSPVNYQSQSCCHSFICKMGWQQQLPNRVIMHFFFFILTTLTKIRIELLYNVVLVPAIQWNEFAIVYIFIYILEKYRTHNNYTIKLIIREIEKSNLKPVKSRRQKLQLLCLKKKEKGRKQQIEYYWNKVAN